MTTDETDSEVRRYLEQRAEVLSAAASTTTSLGQHLDWIDPESQVDGAVAAQPPPIKRDGLLEGQRLVEFELQRDESGRGPAGKVPILRRQATAVPKHHSVARYLSKPGTKPYRLTPDPNTTDGFFHACLDAETVCSGAAADFNVWDPEIDPATADVEDHSLMQLWLVNADNPQAQQSVEAGWTVSRYQYDDLRPHLFTWYTTDNWNAGDGIGGYDATQKGWVQIDNRIYPGAILPGPSEPDGAQAVLSLRVELLDDNWWLGVQGLWIGYYPGTLFSAGRQGLSQANRATRLLFGGEVYSADPMTTTRMGSGAFPAAGFGNACFQERLRVGPDPAGPFVDLAAAQPSQDRPYWYGVASSLPGDPERGSWLLAGGPGATRQREATTSTPQGGVSADS